MYTGTDDDISEADSLPQTAGEDPDTNTKIGNHRTLGYSI